MEKRNENFIKRIEDIVQFLSEGNCSERKANRDRNRRQDVREIENWCRSSRKKGKRKLGENITF